MGSPVRGPLPVGSLLPYFRCPGDHQGGRPTGPSRRSTAGGCRGMGMGVRLSDRGGCLRVVRLRETGPVKRVLTLVLALVLGPACGGDPVRRAAPEQEPPKPRVTIAPTDSPADPRP